MTKVAKRIGVDVPVRVAYDQWTQFEEFPRFMGGVVEVQQLGDRRLHWVAEIGGIRRQWDAEILEQVPDRTIAWAATSGATNAGAVRFAPAGADHTEVTLELEYEPEGIVEGVGDRLHLVEKQVTDDLRRFKELVEEQGHATGAWRGAIDPGAVIGTPGVEAAAQTRGDSGKAGVSRAVKALGALAGAAGVIAVGAAKGARDGATAARRERSATGARSTTTARPGRDPWPDDQRAWAKDQG